MNNHLNIIKFILLYYYYYTSSINTSQTKENIRYRGNEYKKNEIKNEKCDFVMPYEMHRGWFIPGLYSFSIVIK